MSKSCVKLHTILEGKTNCPLALCTPVDEVRKKERKESFSFFLSLCTPVDEVLIARQRYCPHTKLHDRDMQITRKKQTSISILNLKFY